MYIVSDISRSMFWSFARSLTSGLSWNKIKNDINPSVWVLSAERRKRADVVAFQISIFVMAVSNSFARSVMRGRLVFAVGEESFNTLLVKSPPSPSLICAVVVLKGSADIRSMAFCWNSRYKLSELGVWRQIGAFGQHFWEDHVVEEILFEANKKLFPSWERRKIEEKSQIFILFLNILDGEAKKVGF